MTVAIQLTRRAHRLALACLLTGVAAYAMAPVPALAQDAAEECEIADSFFSVATGDILQALGENITCLQERLETLRDENAALRNRIDVLEDERGAVATTYVNRDGEVDREGRSLGPATFVVTGDTRGGPTNLPLDHDRVLAMCGDTDGCLVSLGLAGAAPDGEPVETMFATGPCTLHLAAAEGTWSLSGACRETGLPTTGAAAEDAAEPDEVTESAAEAQGADTAGTASPERRAAPPAAPIWGRDGDAQRFGETQRGRVLLDFAGACFLAESPPETRRFESGPPRFDRDTEAGLFLVAAGRDWDPTGAFPAAQLRARGSAPYFDCRLTFRD